MLVHFNDEFPKINRSVEDVLRAFYGKLEVVKDASLAELKIFFSAWEDGLNQSVAIELTWPQTRKRVQWQESSPITDRTELPNVIRRLGKLALLQALKQVTGRDIGPWGILTGIRPTKIVHRLLDQGLNEDELISTLTKDYALAQAKAELLWAVTSRQREFLHSYQEINQTVGIYIGIPFCPTRCAYCSFPAYSLTKWSSLVPEFLTALISEIVAVGKQLNEQGIAVEHIYVGGGTPTSLTTQQLEELLVIINDNLVSSVTREFTVEAGRPDTLDKDKLLVMKVGGVTRISINPQSMNMATLAAIGRSHTPEEVAETVELARQLGFNNINMDLIIGLPGENLSSLQNTLQRLASFQPENITVHTLAMKRASQYNLGEKDYQEVSPGEAAAMLAECYDFAQTQELEPYYLYRQKQMVGFLENVGFAKSGYECLYNIQVMEERQTIIGLGAGSGSKWVKADFTLDNTYNPKDPGNYSQRIEEIIAKKQEWIRSLER